MDTSNGRARWTASRNVDFLVDNGATRTAIPLALAEQLGVALDGEVRSSTAGGVVSGRPARIDLILQGGAHVQRLRMVVLPQLRAPLRSMDVLSNMSFMQRDGVLRLQPQQR